MDECSMDAVITRPPHGPLMLWARGRFQGSGLDWREAMRVLKPGAHLAVLGDAVIYDALGLSLRLAGFEIRDVLRYLVAGRWLPIFLARKPLEGTIVENILKYGVGAINIDACRIEYVTVDGGNLAKNPHLREHINGGCGGHIIAHEEERRVGTSHIQGRFPANFIHDGADTTLQEFEQFGEKPGMSGGGAKDQAKKAEWAVQPFNRKIVQDEWLRSDTGSAARFFSSVGQSPIPYLQKLIVPPNGKTFDPFPQNRC